MSDHGASTGRRRARGALARWASSCVLLAALTPASAAGACLQPPGDLTGTGAATVADVQCAILAVLWSLGGQVDPPPACIAGPGSPALLPDHDCNGVINVADVQIAILFALGQPLSPVIDADDDQCVDACQSDLDGDGDTDWLDCAPMNPAVHSNAQEQCNGWDDDCNGVVDDAPQVALHASCGDGDPCNGEEQCTPTAQPPGLVISELMAWSAAAPGTEWLELYNGGAAAVNLRGYRLAGAAGPPHLIDPGGALFVPPKAHVVLASEGDLGLNGGVRVNYVYADFSLAGAGGVVRLLDPQLATVSEVPFGAPGFPVPAGGSIALRAPAADPAAPASWAASTASYGAGDLGTPVGPNFDVATSPCAPGTPLDCDSGDPCVVDFCAPGLGCDAEPAESCCGDGVIDASEDCDGATLGGQTCEGLGLAAGALACSTDCTFETSGCGAGCDPTAPPFYASAPVASYQCSFFGIPLVSFSISGWTFETIAGGALRVIPSGGNFPGMTGPMPACPGGSFSVQSVIPGGCCETFALGGTFDTADAWTGTFSVSFCQSPACGCPTGDGFSCSLSGCVGSIWSVQGTR